MPIFEETKEELQKRIEYFKKLSNLVENKKLAFVYDEDKGFHCKVIKDLKKNEPSLRVPNQYLLSQCINIK